MPKAFEKDHEAEIPWSDTRFQTELNDHLNNLHPAISSKLGVWNSDEAIEEVTQTTWESAWNSRQLFNPAVGAFHGWLVTIAQRRATDYVRTKIQQEKLQRKAEQEASATGRAAPGLNLASGDIADDVTDSIVAREQINAILSVVQELIYNPDSVARGLSLIMVFNDDIGVASKSLGISEDALRRSRRELIMCCQVVVKAKQMAACGVVPTLRVLVNCLPEFSEAGEWTRQLALACAHAGGLEAVAVEHVMDVTGYSYNTARQYLVQTKRLLRIAATVITQEVSPRSTSLGAQHG